MTIAATSGGLISRLASRSVFMSLLANTLISTLIVAVVAIACLQRVADEHPRRYLSKALFNYFINTQDVATLRNSHIDGNIFEVYPLDNLPKDSGIPFDELLAMIRNDHDGIAITTYKNRYIAAALKDDKIVVLPQFGEPLSQQAMTLVAIVLLTIICVLIVNYFAIRYLTAPFQVFKRVVRNVDSGNLSFRVPIAKTYGEFRDLANSFNGMLERLDHVNTARKHMLLAIPHEVRTPLARLKVRKDLIEDDKLRNEISRDIDNVGDLLDAILETERHQNKEGKIVRSEIALKPFFRNAISECYRQHRGLQVERRLQLDMRTAHTKFYADAFGMTLVIKNLVSNAVRYGLNQPIRVVVADGEEPTNSLVISVADQGTGIPAEKIPFITEPFWRLDESRQRDSGGYGLGLYLCDTIVKGHEGNLKILSRPGEGTTVMVTLPGALISEQK
ncbi:sensor histidine kinase [Inquilinus sp. OTU3971]|uniref:sensor histidine kinase n=1 Tax=Inquilinus sp. OTU3971 TaxID=3043855 RepID=UPI00313D0A31